MESIFEGLRASFTWDIGFFAHLATLGYVLGFLFKNQLILRFLVLIATVFYIVYYYAFPAEPLWGAILGSVLIMLANIIGTFWLLHDRLPLKIAPEYIPMFKQLRGVQPGEFRRLIKSGELCEAKEDILLTQENEQPGSLYYLMSGVANVVKDANAFSVTAGRFVGEVSFILDGVASATVTVPPGGVYMRWERGKLNKLLGRNPNLRQAFEAQLGRDMAAKVAGSQPIFGKQLLAI